MNEIQALFPGQDLDSFGQTYQSDTRPNKVSGAGRAESTMGTFQETQYYFPTQAQLIFQLNKIQMQYFKNFDYEYIFKIITDFFVLIGSKNFQQPTCY